MMTEPGFIDSTMARVTSLGAGRPGISAVVMTMSCLAMCDGDESSLLGLIFRRHFLGVAAGRLGLLEFLVLDRDELGAEALDLLLGGRAHVGRRHHSAEATGGGDRLRPATPAPMTNTRAAGTVPAAVIIIGMARPYSPVASTTAR